MLFKYLFLLFWSFLLFFQCLVLDKSGNIILLTRAPDLRQAQNTSIIKDIRIWVDKNNSNPNDDLKKILNELKLKGKKIGIEYDAYGLTGKNTILLNESLKNYCEIEGRYTYHSDKCIIFRGREPNEPRDV